jgi:hypothetical protein
MLGSILESLFSCAHRRLTRPLTPVSKPGEPSGETYVVCLDCGKQFSYDWDRMRVGKAIARSSDQGVLKPETPTRSTTKIKYALLGSAIPLAIVLGSKVVAKFRGSGREKPAEPARANADLDYFVSLRHGGPGIGFRVRELIAHIEKSGRDYIIGGEVDCALADHPRPHSLDYWLRENYARNKETRQATEDVIAELLATGLFELSAQLRCPDSGHKAPGLRLKSRAASVRA